MIEYKIDRGFVGLWQLLVHLEQFIDASRFVVVAKRAECLKETRIQQIREERLGQLTQECLQYASDRMDVHLAQQLLRLVGICRANNIVELLI